MIMDIIPRTTVNSSTIVWKLNPVTIENSSLKPRRINKCECESTLIRSVTCQSRFINTDKCIFDICYIDFTQKVVNKKYSETQYNHYVYCPQYYTSIRFSFIFILGINRLFLLYYGLFLFLPDVIWRISYSTSESAMSYMIKKPLYKV